MVVNAGAAEEMAVSDFLDHRPIFCRIDFCEVDHKRYPLLPYKIEGIHFFVLVNFVHLGAGHIIFVQKIAGGICRVHLVAGVAKQFR